MDFHVERSLNRISIQGGVQRHHLRRLCASLHQTIVDRGFSDVVLDFSTCDGVTEAVMLPLMPIHPVLLDFNGVGVISSSFADEVFGRLFVKMGPRAFMTRIDVRNVDPTVGGLIDQAIVQRTRIGNGDT